MKWSNLNNLGKISLAFLALLVVALISGVIGFIAGVGFIQPLRIVFGLVYVLFIPGFILTFIFFPRDREKNIDQLERIALSFALSIAIVPLVIFYLNLIGLKISALTSFFSILGIIVIELLIMVYLRNKRRKFSKF